MDESVSRNLRAFFTLKKPQKEPSFDWWEDNRGDRRSFQDGVTEGEHGGRSESGQKNSWKGHKLKLEAKEAAQEEGTGGRGEGPNHCAYL